MSSAGVIERGLYVVVRESMKQVMLQRCFRCKAEPGVMCAGEDLEMGFHAVRIRQGVNILVSAFVI